MSVFAKKIFSAFLSLSLVLGISFCAITLFDTQAETAVWTEQASARAATEEDAAEYGTRKEDGYLHLDPANIFDTSGRSAKQDGLMGGAVAIIEFIITKIFLPIGVITTTWRVIYIAIFMMMIGQDPLNFEKKARYGSAQKGRGDTRGEKESQFSEPVSAMNSWRSGNHSLRKKVASANINTNYGDFVLDAQKATKASQLMKEELKFMFKGLLVVFLVWGVIEIILRLSVLLLNMAEAAGDSMIAN